MNIKNIVKDKKEAILAIASKHGASNVRIFGSVARGEAGSESDLDILVKMEPGRNMLDLVALWHELEEMLGFSVDIITEGGINRHLRDRILKEAIPL